MSQQKRWKLLAMVWNFIENIQKKATHLAYVCQQSSFYRKYRNTSLAIMNNFSSLDEAISMSRQYEVPLIRLTVADSVEEKFIWQFILNCFQNSQILNQGFIFWPQFSKIPPTFIKSQELCSVQDKKIEQGVIECFCNGKIYKSLKIKELPSNEEQIYEILNKLRSEYYLLINQNNEEKQMQENQQQKQMKLSQNLKGEQRIELFKAQDKENFNEAILESQSQEGENDEKIRSCDEKQNDKQPLARNRQSKQVQELRLINQLCHRTYSEKKSENLQQNQGVTEKKLQFKHNQEDCPSLS